MIIETQIVGLDLDSTDFYLKAIESFTMTKNILVAEGGGGEVFTNANVLFLLRAFSIFFKAKKDSMNTVSGILSNFNR